MRMFIDVGTVYLHRAPVDFRKSINGLAVIERDEIQLHGLLEGYDITKMQAHRALHYQTLL